MFTHIVPRFGENLHLLIGHVHSHYALYTRQCAVYTRVCAFNLQPLGWMRMLVIRAELSRVSNSVPLANLSFWVAQNEFVLHLQSVLPSLFGNSTPQMIYTIQDKRRQVSEGLLRTYTDCNTSFNEFKSQTVPCECWVGRGASIFIFILDEFGHCSANNFFYCSKSVLSTWQVKSDKKSIKKKTNKVSVNRKYEDDKEKYK